MQWEEHSKATTQPDTSRKSFYHQNSISVQLHTGGEEDSKQGCPTFRCLCTTLEDEELSWATFNTSGHVITQKIS